MPSFLFRSDVEVRAMATADPDMPNKVQKVVEGRLKPKNQYVPPRGESVAMCWKKLQANEALKQAVYDHFYPTLGEEGAIKRLEELCEE